MADELFEGRRPRTYVVELEDDTELFSGRQPRNDYVPPPEPPKKENLPPMEVIPPAVSLGTIEGFYDPPVNSGAVISSLPPEEPKVGTVWLNTTSNSIFVWTNSYGWMPTQEPVTTGTFTTNGVTIEQPVQNFTFETDYKFTFDDLKAAGKWNGIPIVESQTVGNAKAWIVSLEEAKKLANKGAVKLSTKDKIKYLVDKAAQLEYESGPNPTPAQVAQIKGYLAEVDTLELVLEQETWNQKK